MRRGSSLADRAIGSVCLGGYVLFGISGEEWSKGVWGTCVYQLRVPYPKGLHVPNELYKKKKTDSYQQTSG